jgi:UDP-N-acetylmuramoylalanine--D-glutamate ligase
MTKALVIGLGISGKSAVQFLLAKGFEVLGVDRSPKISEMKGLKVDHDTIPWPNEEFDLVIVSPGVARSHPLYMEAKKRGIEILDEAELAFRHLNQKSIAITGTNGKTTVTLLVEHLLNSSGFKARALGNVGTPLAAYALQPDPEEILVVELSSYQLEFMVTPSFDAGVILNITPDHLDRYESMEAYAQAKFFLRRCLKKNAPFYVHQDIVRDFPHLAFGPLITFGREGKADFLTDNARAKRGESIEYILPVSYRELGVHDCENALAAWLLVKELGISKDQFCQGLQTFKKPAHRIELVSVVDGISYYNDSKGTNLDATIKAVNCMKGSVILIAGGVDKGASYLPWVNAFNGKVKEILAIGQASQKIYSELHPYLKVIQLNSLYDAVHLAAKGAKEGECVLLSPGCSSYDMFRDYAHRGEEFKRYVNQLALERRKP